MITTVKIQRLINRVICLCINIKFLFLEPYLLFIARKLAKHFSSGDLYLRDQKVSIIIATYSRSEILVKRTIPAVLSQTHKNIEVIVVGDCCIDDTPAKIKTILDPRLIFVDLEKRGNYPERIEDRWFVQGSKPRNHGMSIATGKWFVFLSDDDILYDFHIETLLKNAIQRNLEFISAGYKTIKNGEELTVLPTKNNIESELVCGGMQTWLYRSYLRGFKWNRHSWRKETDKPIDYDLQQRFYRNGVRMGYINDVVYFNPPVEGTNTTGYIAAIQAEKRGKI
jgi:glycosyltransferase involved in cell wall biosynthesis